MTERQSEPVTLGRPSPALTRRRLLTGLTAGAALVAMGRAARAACALTPAQTEGPFYPVAIGEDDWDLTRVTGGIGRAEGKIVEVVGQVLDSRCQPVAASIVEVWQANMHGLYDHPKDLPRGRTADPNFQGYARLTADSDGRYRFVTIVPGAYPATTTWTRPPHIHFKVHPTGGDSLTTQMYFAGHPLNDADRILGQFDAAQRATMEIAFDAVQADGVPRGTFNPVLAVG